MVEWHSLGGKELLKRFESGETGLDNGEAERRLAEYGKNTIESKSKISVFRLLAEQFTDPLVVMLIIAAGLSFLFEHGIDGFLIMGIVILNGLFGFVQNYNAEKGIESLKKMGAPKALVYRNGSIVEIGAENLVPGDILYLKEGTKVGADARLLESEELGLDESILTGESNTVSKNTKTLAEKTVLAERLSMVYMNTSVVRGRGKAIVVSTGKSTEVGKIAGQLEGIKEEPTRFHKELGALSRKIGSGIIVLVVFIGLTLFFVQRTGIIEVIFTAVSLAVAAIPEGLPAVVTLSLAIATQKMLRKKSLVRRLPIVETLGSVDVICTDKTGTLTENTMTVQEIYYNSTEYRVTGTGQSTEGEFLRGNEKTSAIELGPVLLCGLACNDTIIEKNEKTDFIGDPTEIALTVSALKAGLELKGMKRIKDFPFTSERKRMTVVYELGEKRIAYSKGAPEVMVENCSRILIDGRERKFTKEEKEKALAKNEEMASNALRVLAFAQKEVRDTKNVEKGMVFLGLQGMIDPPRKEVREALETARSAGIRVVMLTGDNAATAAAIGRKIGFTGKVVGAWELENLSEQEFVKITGEADMFARISPEEKFMIMKVLRDRGHTVAMTGDGVNDAPALKLSDVGIAMGVRGTDVAKEASDMVLLDDNFATIVEAVRHGRTVFGNIQKFVNYLLTSNLAEVLIIFVSSISVLFLALEQKIGAGETIVALTPIQILWINLLTDGGPALALGADPPKPGTMRQKPRKSSEEIITKPIAMLIVTIGVILSIIVLAIFFAYLPKGILAAQTMVFTSLIVYEFVRIVVIREQEELGFFSNKWLVLALGVSLAMQLFILYNPFGSALPLGEWFGVMPLSLEDWGIIGLGAIIAYFSSVVATRFVMKRYSGQNA